MTLQPLPGVLSPLVTMRRSGLTVLSGLRGWWDAADSATLWQDNAGTTTPAALDGDVVGCWKDKSGNGFHATNATSNQKPLLKLAVQNGRPGLRFDGSNDALVTTLTDALSDFSVFAVYRDRGSVVAFERILDKDYRTGFWIGRNNAVANSWGGGVRETASPYGIYVTLSDAAAHLIETNRSGTTHYVVGDGAATSNTVTSTATDTTSLKFGVDTVAPGANGGLDLFEVLVYNRYLSADEFAAARRYLGGKWGITIS